MDIPNPQAEYLAAKSKSEWTLSLYDAFNGEHAVLSRHKTEAQAEAARDDYAKANPDIPRSALIILMPG